MNDLHATEESTSLVQITLNLYLRPLVLSSLQLLLCEIKEILFSHFITLLLSGVILVFRVKNKLYVNEAVL